MNTAPGEGPSKETRDNGFFWIDFFAKGQLSDGKEVVCRGTVGSDKGDPGYKETAKVCREQSTRAHSRSFVFVGGVICVHTCCF